MANHTPTPWFVSGVRFRMNCREWQSINRYDETKKQDENIACVGYDPRNGLGQADAHFIVKAVNNHDALVEALIRIRDYPYIIGGEKSAPEMAAIASRAIRDAVGGSTK